MSNPNDLLWGLCCAWLFLPIVIAFVAYRWMMRLGNRRLNVIHAQATNDGRRKDEWIFEIDAKVVSVPEPEEPQE